MDVLYETSEYHGYGCCKDFDCEHAYVSHSEYIDGHRAYDEYDCEFIDECRLTGKLFICPYAGTKYSIVD